MRCRLDRSDVVSRRRYQARELSLGFSLLKFTFGVVIWLQFSGLSLFGQGSIDPLVLRTGWGIPLTTEWQPLGLAPQMEGSQVQFHFGFSTDESFSPGQFFDSFTITLQDEATLSSVVYLTADAGGVTCAPFTPGGITLLPASIARTSISFPVLQPVLAYQNAYGVTAPVPSQFAGHPVTLYFDLFDNLDSTQSLGWFSDVSMVPEPGAGVLLAVGGLLGLMAFRFRRR
jgi:hypothetical protein